MIDSERERERLFQVSITAFKTVKGMVDGNKLFAWCQSNTMRITCYLEEEKWLISMPKLLMNPSNSMVGHIGWLVLWDVKHYKVNNH